MRHIFLLSALFATCLSEITCPTNFTILNDSKCVRLLPDKQVHSDAVANCTRNGGHLVSIANAIDNKAILNLANNQATAIWLGLKCSSTNNSSSCEWDDQSGNASSYNAFPSNQPNIDSGYCVFMYISGANTGKWYSGDCDLMSINYVCESSPVNPDTCSFEFNGNCYFPTLSALPESDAEFACEQNCAQLTSIHSSAENDYIGSLMSGAEYLRIGGVMSQTGELSWSDGSVWNYSNVGYTSSNLGYCVSMALSDDIVGKGQWISSKCDTQLPFVCKRASGTHCGSTVSPNQCNGPLFYDNSGTIYSPRYPESYAGETNICNYILDTPIGTQVQVQFPEMLLDSDSLIAVYSRIEDTSPIVVLAGSSASTTWYNSSTNTMKIVFRPSSDTSSNATQVYKWKANFKASSDGEITSSSVTVTPDPNNPSECNSTLVAAPGIITSPNYPNLYPNNLDCLYHLTTNGGYRVHLKFDSVSTEACCDVIVIRDGPYLSSPELGRLSGSPSTSNLNYFSTSNYMLVSFTTDFNQASSGFSATFTNY